MSAGLKKWLIRSGPISPQFSLQIDALNDSCNNWGSGRLYQISRLMVKHILYIYIPWMEFFISCCYTYFLDSAVSYGHESIERRSAGRTSPDVFTISSFDHKFLYRRALVLQRFINLVDSVLPHLVPKWEHSIGTYINFSMYNVERTLYKVAETLWLGNR